jgi:hypothetical protein
MDPNSVSPSHCVFATLTPSNATAKLAFSDAYQSTLGDPAGRHRQYMSVEAEQKYDIDVHWARMRENATDDNSVGESSTDTDDNTEIQQGP